MLFMMPLECHGEVERRLLQQSALGAQLVGGDRFKLGAESTVQDADVIRGCVVVLGRKRVASGEQRNDCPGKNQAGFAEKGPACVRNRFTSNDQKRHGSSPTGLPANEMARNR